VVREAAGAERHAQTPGTHASEERPGRGLVVGNPLPNRLGGFVGADEEAQLVARVLRTVGVEVDALMRNAADKAAVLDKIQGAAWAHFACPTDLNDDSLVLAAPPGGALGGKEADLSMEEVQRHVRMGAGSTAVLSGCNTWGGRITAEGVIGLGRAFLFARAAAIVVSLWDVSAASRAPRASHISHPKGRVFRV
jgi:CHAT domain-containing protein